jgi:hypothetical protein
MSGSQLASALSAEHEPDEAISNAPCRTLDKDRLPELRRESQDLLGPHRVNGTRSPNPGRLPSAGPSALTPRVYASC